MQMSRAMLRLSGPAGTLMTSLGRSAQQGGCVFVPSVYQGGSVAEWLAYWTQAQKARVHIAVAMLSGNSLRQTVHTHRASVHQAAKLIAALLRVGRVTASLAESMAAYRRVYDSRHLQADCQEVGSAPEPYAL